jgi:hypothetical protein
MGEQELQVEETQVETTPEPEIDLSAVPERVREHVDKERYQSDEDYKRAVTHGWKPREVFIEDGGDEASWTGYKVFNRRYDDIQDQKETRKTLEEMKKSQEALLRTMQQEKDNAVRAALQQREEDLKAAIADGDAARAADLQREIIEQRTQAQAAQQQPVLEPLPIRDLRRKNEFLNPESSSFDQELSNEFIGIARQKAEMYFNQYGRKLSDYEIKVIAEEALDMVKDRAKKPAATPAPKAPAASKPATNGAASTDPMKKLNKIQREMYNKMLEVNGKDAAERYIKNLSTGA